MPPLTPLVRPGRYYREFSPSIFEACTIVFLTALVVSSSLLTIGVIAAGGVHVNVAVESPAHPSDAICTAAGTNADSIKQVNGPGCNVPSTTAAFVTGWRTVSAWAPLTFVGVYVVWFGVAVALHFLSRLFADAPSFGDTMAVAGWGIGPLALEALLSLLLVVLAFAKIPTNVPLTGTLSTASSLLVVFGGTIRFLASVGTAVWQGYVWTFGLKRVHDLSITRATVIAGSVTVVLFVLAGL